MIWHISVAGRRNDTPPKIGPASIYPTTNATHCNIVNISCVNIYKQNIFQLCIKFLQSEIENSPPVGIEPTSRLGYLQECLATKLWEWHFQLHDLEYLFCWYRYFVGKYQHTKMLIANQTFAVAHIFNLSIRINRIVYTRCNMEWYRHCWAS